MLTAERCWDIDDLSLDTDWFMYYHSEVCGECVFDAWERMTYGGCGVGADFFIHESVLPIGGYWSGVRTVWRKDATC